MFPELEFQDVIILVAGNNFHLNIIPKKSAVKKHPVRSFARGQSKPEFDGKFSCYCKAVVGRLSLDFALHFLGGEYQTCANWQ